VGASHGLSAITEPRIPQFLQNRTFLDKLHRLFTFHQPTVSSTEGNSKPKPGNWSCLFFIRHQRAAAAGRGTGCYYTNFPTSVCHFLVSQSKYEEVLLGYLYLVTSTCYNTGLSVQRTLRPCHVEIIDRVSIWTANVYS